jgi:UDP-N-acetylglucosamine--N-acetylmuramyl-(pentapeptide) pyrophosphoryl-undecaprenol N-acetylglucosamine transferase
LRDEQPVLAISCGGYAAGPILFQAVRRRIPLVLQEQNAYPGITTRWLSRWACQIHLGFPEARVHLRPGASTEVCQFGTPIAPPPEPRPDRREAKERLGLPADRPALFVIGGSQGARSLNTAVAQAVDEHLLGNVSLLWSTGPANWEDLKQYEVTGGSVVRAFWDPVADAYAAADLAVARAGAMTTAELCAWGIPAILIPLPSAAGGHQARNAKALARDGAAIHLSESRVNGQSLAAEVAGLVRDPQRVAEMRRSASARGHPKAAENIARHILGLVP